MVKVVENNERICTVNLDGSECSIVFQSHYKYFTVKNESDSEVYISLKRDIVPEADGVMTVNLKESATITNMQPNVNMFFASGSGKIQVFASNSDNFVNPFKSAPVADGGVMASGNPIQMDGLQGGVPFSEIVVSGKNLLKYPYHTTTQTINGVTFTDNGDGTITANGTATAISSYALIWKNFYLPKGTYTISGSPEGGDVNTGFYAVCGTDTARFATDTGNGGTFSIIDDTNDFTFSLRINSGVTVDNIVFRPQLELGSTPTAYEPPITGRDLTVNVSGKNLIPYPYSRASGTYNGIELTVHDDGRFDMSGTATASFAILVFAGGSNPIYLSGGQTYTISCNTPYDFSKFNLSARIYHTDGSYTPIIKFPTTFVAQEGNYLTSTLWIDSDVSVSAKNVELQLEYGDTATAYEPYSGATYTITPDSNPYVIPNDIRQQEGLNVVSVSEGEISVTGVRKNAAVKKIWDEIGDVNAVLETVTGGVS